MASHADPLGPFLLRERIGGGGMGEVWSGVHPPSGLAVAVKLITAEIADDPHFRAAFRAEVRSVAGLDHPNVVWVLDHGRVTAAEQRPGRPAGTPYMAMELASEGSLEGWRPADWASLRDALLAVLEALAHAHAVGLVHRDLKPANLLRSGPADARPGLKLSDFGIAWASGSREKASSSAGTAHYMAPEQHRGSWRELGRWTDLYALGCVAWELSCGAPPFAELEEDALVRAHLVRRAGPFEPLLELPDGFEGWVRGLMGRRPDQRPSCAAEAAASLRALDGSAPSSNAMPPWRPPPHRRLPPRIVGAGLGLFALRTVPFMGRELEREILWRELSGVLTGDAARVVVIEGASGHGKSRLARWLAERADALGLATTVTCRNGLIPGASDGLGGALRERLGLDGLDRADALARIRLWLTRQGDSGSPQDGVDGEALALATLAVPDGPGPAAQFSGPSERHAVFAGLLARLGTPVILVVDDAQWSLDGVGLASWLSEHAAGRPVLVLMTVRTEELPSRPEEAAALGSMSGLRVTLAPLGTSERAVLVRELLPLEPSLALKVEERTAGSPLFAIQLVGDWVERGLLAPSERGFVLTGDLPALPRAVAEVWQERLDRTLARSRGPGRGALEIAAALGERVRSTEWATACACAGVPLPEGLGELLLDARLAERHSQGWSFTHAALREVLAEGSVRAGRSANCHAACAEALRRLGAAPERLGHHLLAAGQPDAAVQPLLLVAERCLDQADAGPALLRLDAADKALELAGAPGDDPRRLKLRLLQSGALKTSGELDRAIELARACLTGDPATQARARIHLGRIARDRGQGERAIQELDAAAAAAEAAGDQRLLGWALAELSQVNVDLGAFGLARKQLGLADAAFALLGLDIYRADVAHVLSEIHRREGDLDGAASHLARAEALFRAGGSRWGSTLALNSLGELARMRGALDEAEGYYRRALPIFEALGSPTAIFPRVNLGLVLTERGRHAEALPVLEGAIAWLESEQRLGFAGAIHVSALPCCAGLEDWGAWDAHHDAGVERLRDSGIVDPDILRSAELAAELARRAGESERAAQADRIVQQQRRGLDGGMAH